MTLLPGRAPVNGKGPPRGRRSGAARAGRQGPFAPGLTESAPKGVIGLFS